MSLRLYVALVVLVVSLGGCAARPLAVDASRLPNSLAGVNGLTADRTVLVELVDGNRIEAEALVVTRDDVRFTVGGVALAALGAGVGGVVGSRVQTEPARVLYEGPVERYRDAAERQP